MREQPQNIRDKNSLGCLLCLSRDDVFRYKDFRLIS